MSTIAQSQRKKDADLRRWSSTGHNDARPNEEPGPQIDPRSSAFALAAHNQSEQLSRTHAVDHRARSRPIPSTAQRATLKSP